MPLCVWSSNRGSDRSACWVRISSSVNGLAGAGCASLSRFLYSMYGKNVPGLGLKSDIGSIVSQGGDTARRSVSPWGKPGTASQFQRRALVAVPVLRRIALDRLLRVPNLLAQISLIAGFLNLMQLRFEPVDVRFLVFQEPLEELARCIVALIPSDLNRSVVHRHRVQFQLEIALDLLFDILPDVDMHQLGHAGRCIEEQNSLDEDLGVLHLVDGLLLDERSELVVLPVLTHLRVEEVLVDGRQLFFQRGIQFNDDFRISLHMGSIVNDLGTPAHPIMAVCSFVARAC